MNIFKSKIRVNGKRYDWPGPHWGYDDYLKEDLMDHSKEELAYALSGMIMRELILTQREGLNNGAGICFTGLLPHTTCSLGGIGCPMPHYWIR